MVAYFSQRELYFCFHRESKVLETSILGAKCEQYPTQAFMQHFHQCLSRRRRISMLFPLQIYAIQGELIGNKDKTACCGQQLVQARPKGNCCHIHHPFSLCLYYAMCLLKHQLLHALLFQLLPADTHAVAEA